ncbi:MAG: GNAT family N-acetyltransferase [Nocardioidaceae bacterium]|nr:MAG: GNAT family N-acetyltransferase [Nocardioidaceae bacterium]
MARKIERLTLDTLALLPDEVRECLFWEREPVLRERAQVAGELASEKQAWLSQALLEWGSAGRVILIDDDVVGVIVYAPPVYFPGSASLPTAPISTDCVQLATAYVRPAHRRAGLGRLLMQAMAKDLIQRGGIRSVEAFGATRPQAASPEVASMHSCVLPAEFLLRVGFKTQRPHIQHPRMRLDLKSVLTWREELEAAVEKILGAVRPTRLRKPAPETRNRSR